MLALSLHMNERGGSAFPSAPTLAEETGLSTRAVEGHLRGATEDGWLARKEFPGRGRGWRRVSYSARIPPDVRKALAAVIDAEESGAEGPEASSGPEARNGGQGPAGASAPRNAGGPEASSAPQAEVRNVTHEDRNLASDVRQEVPPRTLKFRGRKEDVRESAREQRKWYEAQDAATQSQIEGRAWTLAQRQWQGGGDPPDVVVRAHIPRATEDYRRQANG